MNMSKEERRFINELSPVGCAGEQMLMREVEDIMIEAVISFYFLDLQETNSSNTIFAIMFAITTSKATCMTNLNIFLITASVKLAEILIGQL